MRSEIQKQKKENDASEALEPSKASSRLIVKNLPVYLDELSLKQKFEKFGEVTDCRIIFKNNTNRRFAFIGYKNIQSAQEARSKCNNTFIDKSKITVDFAQTLSSDFPLQSNRRKDAQNELINIASEKILNSKAKIAKDEKIEDNKLGVKRETLDPIEDNTNSLYDSKRIYVYNFPFNIEAEELEQPFLKYGRIESSKIITKNGQSLGFGFITFVNEDSAIKAIDELDNKIVFGRILHIKRCLKQDPGSASNNAKTAIEDAQRQKIENEKSSFKKIKKQRFFDKIHDNENWNSSFLNPNTVLERMAGKLGITKKELLDNEIENPAVIQGVAEKEVLDEVYDYFDKNGVNVSCLKSGKLANRSRSIMFVKNLPYVATRQGIEELFSRYGSIDRLLLPDNKAIALVEFSNEEHAKNAFEMLADYVYKGTPIYLEWAPSDIFTDDSPSRDPANEQEASSKKRATEDEGLNQEEQTENQNTKTVYVKNLNYQTQEHAIEEMLTKAKIYGYKSVKVVRKENKSLGFGFVEFDTREDAERMIKELQNYILDNHALKLSLARLAQPSTTKSLKDIVGKNTTTNRLVIRNIPFQATKNELADLLKSIVDFKQIRLPQKLDGGLRGFGFLEFGSVDECNKALEQLQNIHFYGRRLAFEFSNQ